MHELVLKPIEKQDDVSILYDIFEVEGLRVPLKYYFIILHYLLYPIL